MTSPEHHKIVLLGDSSVGKSSIVARYINDRFFEYCESTIGAAFFTKKINYNQRDIILDIWDTAGQERYNSLLPMYYRGAQAAIIVYDTTSKDSFHKSLHWYNQLLKFLPNVIIIVAGNKNDLVDNRQVFTKDLQLFNNTKLTHFIDVSAKNNHNIYHLFDIIIHNLPIPPKSTNDISHLSYYNDISIDSIQANTIHKCKCN